MRTFILLLLVFSTSLYSCTSNDDDSTDIDKTLISPPSWILGTWIDAEGIYEVEGFRFTENNMIVYKEGLEYSQNDLIDGYINAGFIISVDQEEEEGWYSVHFNYPLGEEVTYSFERRSNTTIIWVEGEAVYTKP